MGAGILMILTGIGATLFGALVASVLGGSAVYITVGAVLSGCITFGHGLTERLKC
jgi:hypothetical protein